ncbi:MAG TPA: hypothetical protein VLH08_14495 [Acidobacteriota bacterium]|nr:hypothetical protein [Acidobacteriota bacterium]
MKYELLWTTLVCSLFLTLTSCGNESEVEHVTLPPLVFQPQPEAPGLVGTFSGIVQNTNHTRTGTLTISITEYDRSSGALKGSLKLTGFSECYAKGVFPRPNKTNIYDNHYVASRGFGSIIAAGPQPDSYSFLYFEKSDNFFNGLKLNGLTETLAFYDGQNWCLEIDPVILQRRR